MTKKGAGKLTPFTLLLKSLKWLNHFRNLRLKDKG